MTHPACISRNFRVEMESLYQWVAARDVNFHMHDYGLKYLEYLPKVLVLRLTALILEVTAVLGRDICNA